MKKFLLPALFMCLYAGASAAETPKKSTDANLFGTSWTVKPMNIFPMRPSP